MSIQLIKLPPFHFVHVLDKNTQVTRLEVGPKTFRCGEHEQVVRGPDKMYVLPPRHYCTVENPVVVDPATKRVVLDAVGQAKLRHGDIEVRYDLEEPFALYPGEKLSGSGIMPFTVVPPNTALRLHAHRDFDEELFEETAAAAAAAAGGADTAKAAAPVRRKVGSVARKAGDEWLFFGPATYMPRVEVEVVEQRAARIVLPDTALKVRATRACTDYRGKRRTAGEEWLVRSEGAYLPSVDEVVVDTVKAHVLTPKQALCLRARLTYTDRFGRPHRKGEEWLVTVADCETYIPDVEEEVVGTVDITTLAKGQFAVVRDPVDAKGVPQFGVRRLVVGPANFFLQPGESLEAAVAQTYVLGCDDALRVRALEPFVDAAQRRGVRRVPGEEWLVTGPCEYIPPLEVRVLRRTKAFIAIESMNLFIWERSSVVTSAVLALLVLILAIIIPRLLRKL
jgi:major vault protein